MTWSLVERDWPEFLDITASILPLMSLDEARAAPRDRASFRDLLKRNAGLTQSEADELIEFRLMSAYRRARSRQLAA